MADSTTPQPPANSGRGLGMPPAWPGDPAVDAQMEADSLADLTAKQEPTDWPSIDSIHNTPFGQDGLPQWPKDMDVPEIGEERWMR